MLLYNTIYLVHILPTGDLPVLIFPVKSTMAWTKEGIKYGNTKTNNSLKQTMSEEQRERDKVRDI